MSRDEKELARVLRQVEALTSPYTDKPFWSSVGGFWGGNIGIIFNLADWLTGALVGGVAVFLILCLIDLPVYFSESRSLRGNNDSDI